MFPSQQGAVGQSGRGREGDISDMQDAQRLAQENADLRERVAVLSAAMLRISASLDVVTVLREIIQGARSLAGARYGVIVTIDGGGLVQDVVTSGFTDEEERRITAWEEGVVLFERLGTQAEALRVNDMREYVRSLGLADSLILSRSLQAVPMRYGDALVGSFFIAGKEAAPAFTDDDEELLTLFAAQAAVAVTNSRAHRAEVRARSDVEALVETSPVGVVVLEAGKAEPLFLNREATRILGQLHKADSPIDKVFGELVVRREDGRDVVVSPSSFVVEETVRGEEVALSLPNGRSVPLLISTTPIRSEDGAVRSAVVAMQDLGPLKEMERRNTQFVSLVSHELRAPLAAIKGSAATVLGAPADLDKVEMREFFRVIDEQADQMRALIADLLDAGRIEAGSLSVAPERTELAALLEPVRRMLATSGGDHPLRIDLPPDLPAVMADRQRIVQVLNNLCVNAVRHSPASSPIRIEAAREGVHVAVSVADDGAGVPAERLTQLFSKESGADDGGRLAGTGLGLAISKGIVEAHGGRIRAESPGVGQGMKVTFTLPADEGGRTGTAPGGPRVEAPMDGRIRVLVLDDDPQALRFVRRALANAGYEAVVSSDPEELAGLVRTERPDLVLLDLRLPGTDGIELMGLTPGLAELPVIFISAYGHDGTIARALEAGAADFIAKPFSPTELIARVRSALRLYHQPPPFKLRDLAIDYDRRVATLAGERLALTATEYNVLRLLSLNAGGVTTNEALRRDVWGRRERVPPTLVRTYIKRLRTKLGDDPRQPTYIFNERAVGYRMPRH